MKQSDNIFLSIGTNIGNRRKNILEAVKRIKNIPFNIHSNASIYRTEPVGCISQDDFFNTALKGATPLSPAALLEAVKAIESDMGRKKSIRWGPRLIDIDILIYNDIIIKNKELTIPHKRIMERYFILIMLNEIEPGLIIPSMGAVSGRLKEETFSEDIEKIEYINFTQEIL